MVGPPQPTAVAEAAFQGVPRETIRIVHTSRCMNGASMEQAKAAVGHALSTLTLRDRFNVLEFNSVMHPLYPSALPATTQTLAPPHAWVATLRAAGGPGRAPPRELALVLRNALARVNRSGHLPSNSN